MSGQQGRPKGDNRRNEILDDAATLFASEGVAKASMAEIGRAVGMHKASLYYFFDSKEALLQEVLRPVVEQPLHELRQIV